MLTSERLKDARSKKRAFILGLLVVLVIIDLIIFVVNQSNAFAILFAAIAFLVLMFVLLKGNDFYREIYKNEVIKGLVKTYDSNLFFDSKYGISLRDYNMSKFDNNFNAYYSEDRIFGKFDNGSEIQLAEIKTERVETYRENGHTEKHSYETFSGLYGVVKLKRNLLAKIDIYCDSHLNRYSKDRIEIDSAEFEEYYDLLTKDKILALKIFTPELIEKFNELRREHPKYNFELKIENEKIYFRFRCGHGLFEPPRFKSDLDKELLRKYFKLIYYPIELTKMISNVINDVEE
jgi:hypothetical protein